MELKKEADNEQLMKEMKGYSKPVGKIIVWLSLAISCLLTWSFLDFRRDNPEVDFVQNSDALTSGFVVFCVSLFGLIIFFICSSAFLMKHLYPYFRTHFKSKKGIEK
jgi:hypothetical protein